MMALKLVSYLSFVIYLGFGQATVLAKPSPGNSSIPKVEQLRPALTRWLDSFRQDMNLLSSRADSANWPTYRQTLRLQYGFGDSLSVPNLLRPAALYRAIGGTLPADAFLSRLSTHFNEGFQYEIDTTAAVLTLTNCTTTRCQLMVTVPVRLHGLVGQWAKRVEITDRQTFVLEGRFEKKRLASLRIVSLRGNGESAMTDNSEPDRLSIGKLLSYQQRILTNTLLMTVEASTRATVKTAYENLGRLLKSDTLWVQWDSAAPSPVALTKLRSLNLSEEQLATARIASFDVEYISRFYRDLDNQSYGEQTQLTGVCASLIQSRLYESKSTKVVRVPTLPDPSATEYVQVSHVILALSGK